MISRDRIIGTRQRYAATSCPPRCAGQKWDDAKEEARESGHEAKASVRDAASALGDETRRGLDKADHETRRFFNRAGEAVRFATLP